MVQVSHRWMRLGVVALVGAVLAAPTTARAGKLEQITTVEGITEYQLANGLQVLLFPDPSKPTVTVNVTYLVGSRHEGRGEKGMAHLLEHMVFQGTPTYETIWSVLEDHGARFNGTTWLDRTNYYETLPATDENLEFALHMEADRMVNSNILADVLAKEFSVVRNEFEMGENNPILVLWQRMMSSAFLWHNYGNSTIGNRSDIERVPAPNLRAFYEKYYQPDNAMLVVAGKFDPEPTLELIQKFFGAIPRPTRTIEPTYTVEPPQDGSRMVSLERVGDTAAAGLVYHVPAGTHPDYPAVELMAEVLTSEPSGHVYKALVEGGKTSSIFGFSAPLREPGFLLMLTGMRTDQDTRAILDEMIAITEGVASKITNADVERVKTRKLKDIKMALANSGQIGIELSEWAAQGDWRMFFLHRDRIKAVSTDDVRRAASDYLIASNRTAGMFVPTKDPKRITIPDAPAVADLVEGYTGSETIAQGEEFEATPENIDKRTERKALAENIKVAFLPKETRGDAVHASFRFHFGTEKALAKQNRQALELMPFLVMRGTTNRSFEELKDQIDSLQSEINVTGGVGNFGASIVSDRANLAKAIELLGEVLKTPAFDAKQFAIVKKEQLTALEQGLSDPQALGFTWLRQALNPYPKTSVHYVPTLVEQIAGLNEASAAGVKKLHAEFWGAVQAEIAIVGDFDPKEIGAAITRSFGSWKPKARYSRIAKPHKAAPAATNDILTPDKKMAVVGMGTTFALRDDDPDYPALQFASYILGQSAKSRLLERLRQKEGLSYGAGAQFQVDDQDERAAVISFAICAPQNAAKAQDVMREEVQRWIDKGVTPEELAEGKKSYALQFQNRMANDRNVARELASSLEIERTMQYHRERLDVIDDLDTSAVQKVLKKYLYKAPMVEMKAGDLEKKETEPGASS